MSNRTQRPPDHKRKAHNDLQTGPYLLPCSKCQAPAGAYCVKVLKGDGKYRTSPSQAKAEMHMERLDAYNASLRAAKGSP